jgi:hypothetical protein
MARTSESMKTKIDENQVYQMHLHSLKRRVFQRLNVRRIERKREKIMSSIIAEKHSQLLVLDSLTIWKDRMRSRMIKYQLYDQVESDYNNRKLRQVLLSLRDYVIDQKLQKIEEIIDR